MRMSITLIRLLKCSRTSSVLFYILLVLVINIFLFANGHGDDDHEAEVGHNKVLLISLSGFRHDFVDRGLQNLLRISHQGVRADSLIPSFVTKTAGNHFSIVTGLYQESHGITGNDFYDPNYNITTNLRNCSSSRINCAKFMAKNSYTLWNLNEHGKELLPKMYHGHGDHETGGEKRSGLFYWPGAGIGFNGYNATFETAYVEKSSSQHVNLTRSMDIMLGWFTNEASPINFGLLYYEELDEMCQLYGPDSQQVENELKIIDDAFGYLLERLEAKDLDDLNVVIVSDHGHAPVDIDHYINLDECIKSTIDYHIVGGDPVIGIWPNNLNDHGLRDGIYKDLQNCTGLKVYKNESSEMKKYHYSNNDKIPPIIVITDVPAEGKPRAVRATKNERSQTVSVNGWFNTWKPMHATFIAKGPAFKVGHRSKAFENVNIFPLICHILDIKCPPSNGNLENVKDMLAEAPSSHFAIPTLIAISLFCALIAGVMVIGVCRQDHSTYTYNIRNSTRQTFFLAKTSNASNAERSTLLASSDDEF